MKRLLLTIALVMALTGTAFAQDSTSSSNGTSTSNSTSSPTVTTGGNGNSSSNGTANSMSQSNPNNANAQNIVFNSTSGGASTMDSTAHVTTDGTTTQRLEGGTNSTVRNINEGTSTQRVEYSGTQTVKNVPSIQMSGPASGPCTGVSGGVGVSGPGWGVGFNGSAVMDDCRLRENTRVLGMAMQSIDGNANPQERGEVTVLFMDAVRNLAAYNTTIYNRASKEGK